MSIKYEHQNYTWETNHESIENAYLELLKENLDKGINKKPNITEIARRSGLARVSVYKHLDSITMKNGIALINRLDHQDILDALCLKAKSGDVAAIKLYAQLVLEYSEKSEKEVSIKETPTIKIERAYKTDKTENENIEETTEQAEQEEAEQETE